MDLVKDRKGSLMIVIPVLMTVVAIFAQSFLLWFQARQRVSVRTTAQAEIMNLSTMLKMSLSSNLGCDLNRTAGAFGANLSQLNNLSALRNIQILSPAGGGIALAKVGQQIEHLRITEIYFSPQSDHIKIPNENSYIANLFIQTVDPYSRAMSAIIIPFYLVTNASGDLTGCFATTYADSSAETPTTAENFLCETVAGSNLVYSPTEHTCIPQNTVVTGN